MHSSDCGIYLNDISWLLKRDLCSRNGSTKKKYEEDGTNKRTHFHYYRHLPSDCIAMSSFKSNAPLCVYRFFFIIFSLLSLSNSRRNVYRRCHCVTDRWNGIRLGIYFCFLFVLKRTVWTIWSPGHSDGWKFRIFLEFSKLNNAQLLVIFLLLFNC